MATGAQSVVEPETLSAKPLIRISHLFLRDYVLKAKTATIGFLCAAAVAIGLFIHFDGAQTSDSPAQLSTEEIVSKCEAAVALIRGKYSVGTGFLAKNKLVVTNAHVIEFELIEDIRVFFPAAASDVAEGPYRARLIYENPSRDLAILWVDTGLKPLHLADDHQFRRGQDITVIGNPGIGDGVVLENAVSRGIMSTRATINGRDFHQISIAINPGNSGGPVINSAGEVIGVATLKAREKEGVAFCVPLPDLHSTLVNVASQSDDAIIHAASHHSVLVAFCTLRLLGDTYTHALNSCAQIVKEALDRGEAINGRLIAPDKEMQNTLTSVNMFVARDLDALIEGIAADPHVDVAILKYLQELRDNYVETKRYVDNPATDLRKYPAIASKLTARRDRLVVRLSTLLALPVED